MGAKKTRFDYEKIYKLAARGLTQEQIARSIGMSPENFCKRKKDDEELVEALENGKASGIEQVANALFENAVGGNAASQIFYLKARSPDTWKDTGRVEITGKDGGALQSQLTLTNEEFAVIAKKLLEEV